MNTFFFSFTAYLSLHIVIADYTLHGQRIYSLPFPLKFHAPKPGSNLVKNDGFLQELEHHHPKCRNFTNTAIEATLKCKSLPERFFGSSIRRKDRICCPSDDSTNDLIPGARDFDAILKPKLAVTEIIDSRRRVGIVRDRMKFSPEFVWGVERIRDHNEALLATMITIGRAAAKHTDISNYEPLPSSEEIQCSVHASQVYQRQQLAFSRYPCDTIVRRTAVTTQATHSNGFCSEERLRSYAPRWTLLRSSCASSSYPPAARSAAGRACCAASTSKAFSGARAGQPIPVTTTVFPPMCASAACPARWGVAPHWGRCGMESLRFPDDDDSDWIAALPSQASLHPKRRC